MSGNARGAGFEVDAARQVLMVQAFESAEADSPLWTADDRAWATRQARAGVAADAPAPQFLAERARHALQRLQARDAQIGGWLDRREWPSGWTLLAAAVGLLAGLLADSFGASQRINLLAPPVWAVIAWNLVVYAALAWGARPWRRDDGPSPLRRGLTALLRRWRAPPASAPLQRYALAWTRVAAPLALSRLALLLHAAAAALAVGLMLGLYLRGLVLDYRAGWQSTFLGAPAVQGLLSTLLAPAAALTGITVPTADALAAMRVVPGAEPQAPAADWIHLYATMLLLFVVLPRGLLAALAACTARRLAHAVELPLQHPYFVRLLAERRGDAARVPVWPFGAAASAQTALALRSLLARRWGESVQLQLAEPTAHGDEPIITGSGDETPMRIALFDLSSTPEAEAQGRFVEALRAAGGGPLLVLVDEAGFKRRFGKLPQRLDERRATWQRWADDLSLPLLITDLGAPDAAAAGQAFERLGRLPIAL